jgi:hypothetical protein
MFAVIVLKAAVIGYHDFVQQQFVVRLLLFAGGKQQGCEQQDG